MNAAVQSALEFLKAKVQLMVEHYDDPDYAEVLRRRTEEKWQWYANHEPAIVNLREYEEPIELELRNNFSKEKRVLIRSELVAKFGRSTVGETWEVTAKKILARGEVKAEDAEAMKTYLDDNMDDAIEALGEADATRLEGLLTAHLRT
jgi:hypothetical protein